MKRYICEHICSNDFPETIADLSAMEQHAGFQSNVKQHTITGIALCVLRKMWLDSMNHELVLTGSQRFLKPIFKSLVIS